MKENETFYCCYSNVIDRKKLDIKKMLKVGNIKKKGSVKVNKKIA
jgi:hypothetical protein